VKELNELNQEQPLPLMVSTAEIDRNKKEDFPEAYEHLLEQLKKIDERCELFYVCGADHVENVVGAEFPLQQVIAVKRVGTKLANTTGFFAIAEGPTETAAASSTQVRTLIESHDIRGLKEWMTPQAAHLAYNFYNQGFFRRGSILAQLERAYTVALEHDAGDLVDVPPTTKQPESIVVATVAALKKAVAVEATQKGKATFTVVQGMDAREIGKYARDDRFGGSNVVHVQQIASQFNFLESTNAHYMPISIYHDDKTQGPLASLACPRALVERDAWIRGAFHDGQETQGPYLQPTLRNFTDSAYPDGSDGAYRGGYLEMWSPPLPEAIRSLEATVKDLKVAFQYGKTREGPLILQVFQAAPSFQGLERWQRPDEHDPRTDVCKLLVSGEYVALGRIAILEAHRRKRRVSLHATMVGQGMFGNHASVFADALRQLVEVVREHPIDVFLHGFKQIQVKTLQTLLEGMSLSRVKETIIVMNQG
jgi:hypothetical protein